MSEGRIRVIVEFLDNPDQPQRTFEADQGHLTEEMKYDCGIGKPDGYRFQLWGQTESSELKVPPLSGQHDLHEKKPKTMTIRLNPKYFREEDHDALNADEDRKVFREETERYGPRRAFVEACLRIGRFRASELAYDVWAVGTREEEPKEGRAESELRFFRMCHDLGEMESTDLAFALWLQTDNVGARDWARRQTGGES